VLLARRHGQLDGEDPHRHVKRKSRREAHRVLLRCDDGFYTEIAGAIGQVGQRTASIGVMVRQSPRVDDLRAEVAQRALERAWIADAGERDDAAPGEGFDA